MHRFQMIGGCGIRGFGGLQDLLVPLVHQFGNLSVNQVAGISEDLRATVVGAIDRRRDLVLLQKHSAICAGRLRDFETMIAKP